MDFIHSQINYTILGGFNLNTNLKEFISRKKMPIIVSLPENDIDLAKAAIDAGADALKVHINVSHRASGNKFHDVDYYKETFEEIRELYNGPFGIVLSDNLPQVDEVDLKELKQIGFTYFSLYAKDITTKLLLQNELEKTIALDSSFNPNDTSVLESFNLEVLELSVVNSKNYGKPLSFEDLILYENYRRNTDLPLMIPSQKKMKPHDLKILRNIGIDSVMLGEIGRAHV